ncbi:hypothetical protein VOLCADRAFT_95104 [Volvox carteri f. nagariensis]|uniref:Uncharacterized protein n=1 Tax=Volvox carteri f. nagariensis TaxID=3068 RepID=D8U6L6_VOLCA|nr:uncharacterized protein VOLCADRAFT_95104 [Volvox carteri f. nagariensis]EFJ44736.1 hypothetical protein VOLCADRAFT_95104 [Volvox carteri f. nagariensis]|eukprot:XP_002954312.1 hypothetical protein VOLCADRAFT_95104 [Volvox carteri f. nagariensis]
MATCNATDARQKFGLFLGHPADGPLYFVVPSFAINATGVSPRCLRQNSASFVVLMPCTDDDLDQRFEIRSFTAGRPPRMLPPSPPPPTPSPNAPPQQWYPYSLVFRTDWYPIGGSVNLNDYDYMAGHNGYGDYSYGVPLDDLDIMASWTWNGATYTMGRWAQNADNISATTGAEYGGDNTKYGTQYEIVYFPAGVSPPPTDFYVCVAWTRTQTSTTRVVLTMYKGYAVASTTKVFNTTRQSDYSCTPSSAGYVGSFNPSAPSPPPPPPSPTIVQQSYPYPLLLRTDWTIISGVRGRSSKPYDFDILVSWTEGNTTFMVGSVALTAGRAVYGGDNLRNNGTNYEYVYWPAGASLPATNTLHVCVRWNGNPKPLARVMLSVYHGTRFTTSTTMVDTTFDWSETCVPGAIGYIDSYWLGQARSLLDDLGYSNCYTPPVPSSATSLYFLVQWTPANSTSPGPTLFDWDLVVTWSYGGAAYEISPYLRFVASAVHGGDNMRVSVPGNSEAVYWPTGLTGMEPSPTQYDVCVRWYTRGRLNVTLTVFLYTNPVLRVTKTLESVAVNSKTCSQYAVGYVGSYNYTGGSAPARQKVVFQAQKTWRI